VTLGAASRLSTRERADLAPMCRIFGCVASEPVSIRHELLRAENPMIHQSQEHDSGWGLAAYPHADGGEPRCVRFPEAAHADGDFHRATDMRGRIFNVHVRRATMGGLTLHNTHPFCLGDYSFSHNGTILDYPRLLEPGVSAPAGDTDSEHFFNFLMRDLDPGDVPGSLRRAVTAVIGRSAFSGLNLLMSEGERLYAYRLGMFQLHWLARPGQLLVASEKITSEPWHSERLVGDAVITGAQIREFEEGAELRGAARGSFAADRAARLAGAARPG
jgi:predicted glutamine amidotransferase